MRLKGHSTDQAGEFIAKTSEISLGLESNKKPALVQPSGPQEQ